MNYVIVALVFVVLIMLYLGYTFFANKEVIKSPVSLRNTVALQLDTVDWEKMASPGATTYNYQGWLYLKERNENTTTIPVIFYRGSNSATNTQFIVGMDNQQLNIYTKANITSGSMQKDSPTTVLTVMNEFPIQKWVFFVINVVNGSIIECFINGKLVQSYQSPPASAANSKLIELAPETRTPLHIGGTQSLNGYITKFKRDPASLNTGEVWNAYLEGNGLGAYTDLTGGYGAVLSLLSKEGEIQKLTIL